MYLTPMETTEIIIDEVDIAVGNGSNFIFNGRFLKLLRNFI